VAHGAAACADRDTLVDKLFEGCSRWRTGSSYPLDPMTVKELPRYKRPGAGAGAAGPGGWTPGPDGICRNARGYGCRCHSHHRGEPAARAAAAAGLQNQWKAACIEVTIKNEPARTFFGETLKKRSSAGWDVWLDLSVSYPPRQIAGERPDPPTPPTTGWQQLHELPHADRTRRSQVAETELDPDKRAVAWRVMPDDLLHELPVLPLFFSCRTHVLRNG